MIPLPDADASCAVDLDRDVPGLVARGEVAP